MHVCLCAEENLNFKWEPAPSSWVGEAKVFSNLLEETLLDFRERAGGRGMELEKLEGSKGQVLFRESSVELIMFVKGLFVL